MIVKLGCLSSPLNAILATIGPFVTNVLSSWSTVARLCSPAVASNRVLARERERVMRECARRFEVDRVEVVETEEWEDDVAVPVVVDVVLVVPDGY